MQAEIINIGSELTTGRITNGNAAFLSRKLTDLGFRVSFHTVVPDQKEPFLQALKVSGKRAKIIIITGGLGPTTDDITTEVITSFLGQQMVRNASASQHLRKLLDQRRRILTTSALKMAYLPSGAKILKNHNGMAAGYYFSYHGSTYFVCPGVPHEMEKMFELEIAPLLNKGALKQKELYYRKTLRVFGLAEAKVGDLIQTLGLVETVAQWGEKLEIGYEVSLYDLKVHLEIFSKSPAKKVLQALNHCENLIRSRLGRAIFTGEDRPLSEAVHASLLTSGLSLALAESCTGGLLGAALTNHAGSSKYLLGGVICYSNESKQRELGVPTEILLKSGAVSPACAEAMAHGVQKRFHSDLALAITGIAGPDGGSADKPVGTVYIALAAPQAVKTFAFLLRGNRERVRALSVANALNLLRLALNDPAFRVGVRWNPTG